MITDKKIHSRKPFDFEGCEILIEHKRVCPYYRKIAFDTLRCMGGTITGKCGHPGMICPIPDWAGVD